MVQKMSNTNTMRIKKPDTYPITMEEQRFLDMARSQELRPHLLDRLEKLGLLSAFLKAESGTIQ